MRENATLQRALSIAIKAHDASIKAHETHNTAQVKAHEAHIKQLVEMYEDKVAHLESAMAEMARDLGLTDLRSLVQEQMARCADWAYQPDRRRPSDRRPLPKRAFAPKQVEAALQRCCRDLLDEDPPEDVRRVLQSYMDNPGTTVSGTLAHLRQRLVKRVDDIRLGNTRCSDKVRRVLGAYIEAIKVRQGLAPACVLASDGKSIFGVTPERPVVWALKKAISDYRRYQIDPTSIIVKDPTGKAMGDEEPLHAPAVYRYDVPIP